MNWPDDFINKIICGDNLSVMKEMPAETIDMIMTSPPYWGLRDYGTGPDQLGLELTPELYIEHLTEIFNEVKRILKKEGTFWLNMGDTYWSATGTCFNPGGGKNSIETKRRKIYPLNRGNKSDVPNLPPKCLAMIPERLAWSLIQNGWILRNKNIWHKRNSMPSSVTDRFNNTYEFVYMFSRSQRYYFDLDAVREPYTEPLNRWGGEKIDIPKKTKWKSDDAKAKWAMSVRIRKSRPHPSGKNPGDVFEINTQPFPDAHFAVFPEKLCERPIKAGCPEEVCKKCGKARERIIKINYVSHRKSKNRSEPSKERMKAGGASVISKGVVCNKVTQTIGWTSCDCKAGFESGIVLDPFCGAGTALYVAQHLKRKFIGIDIKKEYCELAEKRLAQGVL